MTPTTSAIDADIRPVTRIARARPWIALAAAGVLFALSMFGLLPFIYAAPVIGVVLRWLPARCLVGPARRASDT